MCTFTENNGNGIAVVSATTFGVYEYGPFGEVIRATGPMAKQNPFRFSTKYDDDESDFLYYGHRYYNPSTGRWINRDMTWERGGLNLYAFDRDGGLNSIDALGDTPLHLEFNAFIFGNPPPGYLSWIPEPVSGSPYWFSSDWRGFFRQPDQTARLRTEVDIESTGVSAINTGTLHLSDTVASPSHRYIPPDGAIETKTAQATGGAWQYPSQPCSLTIVMDGHGQYPFTPPEFTPSIDYTVIWTLRGSGTDSIEVTVEGTHKMFPCYEAVINWNNSVYQFAPTDTGPSPINLNTTTHFSASKTITAETGGNCGCPYNFWK